MCSTWQNRYPSLWYLDNVNGACLIGKLRRRVNFGHRNFSFGWNILILSRRSLLFFRSCENFFSVCLSQLTLWSFKSDGIKFWRGQILCLKCKLVEVDDEKSNSTGQKIATEILNPSKWRFLKIFHFYFKEGLTTKGKYLGTKVAKTDESQSVLRNSDQNCWLKGFVCTFHKTRVILFGCKSVLTLDLSETASEFD